MENKLWQLPVDYPDLSSAKMIAIDVETYDPHLFTAGPGGIRKDGYLLGVSVASDTGFCKYYPLAHRGINLNPTKTVAWLNTVLDGPQPKIGANILYDIEWLYNVGVKVGGPKYDIQVAEPLLDENKFTYKLEALAHHYLGVGKQEETIERIGSRYSGILKKYLDDMRKATKTKFSEQQLEERKRIRHRINEYTENIKGHLNDMPAWAVAPYCEMDSLLALDIIKKQLPLLKEEGLLPLFELETRLLDCIWSMRLKGSPVDVKLTSRLIEQFAEEEQELQSNKDSLLRGIDIWSNKAISKKACSLGLVDIETHPRTEKNEYAFETPWLLQQPHIFYQSLAKARRLDRFGKVFLEEKILKLAHNGRIHGEFYTNRRDDGGTRSGRLSARRPNMQQFPSPDKDPEYARLVRSVFIPEEGQQFLSADYSQIEPRVTVHYSYLCKLQGAEQARDKYLIDKKTDYHTATQELIREISGVEIGRKNAKILNLGLSYGMGKAKLADSLGLSLAEAEQVFSAYHSSVGYMQQLSKLCQRKAESAGCVTTFLGRKRRFNLYGPRKWTKGIRPLPFEQAKKEYGNRINRYFTYKAMNSLIQGTAADIQKKCMVDVFEAGYVPHNTIHDELCFSIADMKQAKEIKEIMENTVELEVPLLVDCAIGPNWGEIKEVEL